uniref:Ig-like domain-containing protein n=1 Tax=Poecilia formosa TaxID=48698 RepID=A0A096M2B7_POEFO
TTGPGYEGRITLFRSTGSLELRNLKLSDSGEYLVVIQDGLAQHTGRTSLELYAPVSNVKVTPDVTQLIEFSGSVSFSCSSSGSSLSFLWMNSSSEVSASDRVQITDGGSKLTINNVTRYDDGSYSCHVSNPASSASSDPLHLSVSYGPEKVNLESPSQNYPEGSNIRLSCSADSRPPATFEWFFNGSVLPGSGSQLELINVQKNQSGNYSCQAFNNITSRYETSEVSVISLEDNAKEVLLHKFSKTILFRPSAICCSTTKNGVSGFWIFFKNLLELYEDRVQIKTNEENSNLTIVNVTRNDQGSYRCNVSNPVSSVISDPVDISVNFQYASKPGGLVGGAIAGIVIACLLVVAAGAAGGYFIYKRRKDVKPGPH